MIDIQTAESVSIPLDIPTLGRAAQATLQYRADPIQADVTIMLSDDEQLQQLNLQFLGIDAPTDVLAFPAQHTDPDTQTPYLGDVLISVPRAIAQAKAGGHSLDDELQLLVVHGILHLLDYDHIDESDKARMWSAQAEILAQLGCSLTAPP